MARTRSEIWRLKSTRLLTVISLLKKICCDLKRSAKSALRKIDSTGTPPRPAYDVVTLSSPFG